MTTHDREQIITAAKEAGCTHADLLYDIAEKIEEIRALAYEDGHASRDAEIATLRADANEVQAARHVQREHNDLLVKNHKLRKQVKMLEAEVARLDKGWREANGFILEKALAATEQP